MNKRNTLTNPMMMEMCMWIWSMCMVCRAYHSDGFSIQSVNACTA